MKEKSKQEHRFSILRRGGQHYHCAPIECAVLLATIFIAGCSSGGLNDSVDGSEVGEVVIDAAENADAETTVSSEGPSQEGEVGTGKGETHSDDADTSLEDGGTTDTGATDTGNAESTSTDSSSDTSAGDDPSRDNPCSADPVVHWTLDEMGGLVAHDSASGANHGIHQGGPTPVVGSIDNALQFDGVDDYVQVLSADEINYGVSDFSIVYWIRTTSLETGYIVSKRGAGLNGYHTYIINGQIHFLLGDDRDYTWHNSGLVIADGEWHEIRVSVDRDSTTGGKFYIDDVLVEEFDPTQQQGSVSNESPLYIGRSAVGTSNHFLGSLDEIRLYDQACE